jgi:linoleoyl-CoA desaturase
MTYALTIPEEAPAESSTYHAGASTPGYLKFAADREFYSELRRRVDDYFLTTGRRKRDCPRMYVKTAVIMSWFGASYMLLVFAASNWWQAVPLAISLALSMAAIGFNVQHDGGHSAYSRYRWINKLMAMSLDLLGGSSYVWERKHGLHHSYANIVGHDDDINIGIFGRIAPHQQRRSFHRFQHLYLWVLYGVLPIKWQLYDDFRDVIQGRTGEYRFARPRGWELALFLIGKCVFFSLAFGVPLLRHSLGTIIGCYLMVSLFQGLALSIVFQLPHCGEESAFPMPADDTGRIEAAWAVHQVQTTVDYAQRNPLVTWFAGGLNYQIEHHLFPRICHVNYKAIAPLVEQTCRDFGIRYFAHPSLRAGMASHYRLLKRMGQPSEN